MGSWEPKTARVENSRKYKRDGGSRVNGSVEESLSPMSRNSGKRSRLSTQRLSNILTQSANE
jgi:hypothetical protein